MTETQTADSLESVDILRIMEMIPHRYPMLLIDRIVDLKRGDSAIGIKNVTMNEPQFTGHFPSQPVMPGVMIVESMAQTAAVVVVHALGPDAEGKLVYFMTIDEARFRRPVTPGDRMYIHVTALKRRGTIWKFKGEVKVDDKLAAEAIFSAMILDKK
jgi:3-hydroxyacyl-[acyl-carrier-protein] dehydratase